MSRMLPSARPVAAPVLALGALLALLALAVLPLPARAAGPIDAFATAEGGGSALAYGFGTRETTQGATVEAGELLTTRGPGYCQNAGGTITVKTNASNWSSLTGTGRSVSVRADAPFGTVLAVYRTRPFLPLGASLAAIQGALVDCDFDDAHGLRPPVVTFDSAAGATYWVQVGPCREVFDDGSEYDCNLPTNVTSRDVNVSPSGVAAPYDAVGGAAELTAGRQYDNVGATDAQEDLSCNGVSYGATVWTTYRAPTNGRLVVRMAGAAGFNGVVSIYTDGTRLGCGAAVAEARVTTGRTYQVQVGGNRVSTTVAQGFFTLDAAILEPDADADGTPDPADCRPADASVRPGAVDVPGNGVDEDCSGADARFKRVVTTPGLSASGGRLVRITGLELRDVPARARIVVRCGGSGCIRAKRVVAKRTKRAYARYRIARSPFRIISGRASLKVDVTRPGWIGRRLSWTFRPGTRKVVRYGGVRCLPPAGAPRACR